MSDDLAKLIASNSHRADDIDGHSAEAIGQENDMPLEVTAKMPTSKIPVGSYIATCTGIIEDAIPESQYNPDIYRFLFDVDGKKDDEGNQATTDAISSRALSPKSKLWDWLVAFGLNPQVGKTIDLEGVIGRKVMIVVEQNGEYTRVGKLVPLPEGMAQPAPSTSSEPDDVPWNEGGTKPPLADALAEASALATIVDEAKKIGFSMKEIIDVAQSEFGKPPKDLTAEERDRFQKALGV